MKVEKEPLFLQEEYLSDEELLQLMMQVEEQKLMPAPPSMLDEILAKADACSDENQIKKERRLHKVEVENGVQAEAYDVQSAVCVASINERVKRKEFHRYCIRVITSVAAAVALIFIIPGMEQAKTSEIPSKQEMVGAVITREEALRETEFFPELQDMWNLYSKKDITLQP